MRFAEWKVLSGWTQERIARELGASQEAVSKWMRGHNVPRIYWVQAIDKLTNGQVTVNDWATKRTKRSRLNQPATEPSTGNDSGGSSS